MDQVYIIAFDYYIYFYSYKGKLKRLRPWFFLTSILGIGFILSIFLSYPEGGARLQSDGEMIYAFRYMVLFEALFLLSLTHLRNKRDSLVIGDYSKFPKHLQLVLAKRRWIRKVCNKTEVEYLEFAQELRQLRDFSKISFRQGRNWYDVLGHYIYNPEAKSRIMSLFIFLMSLVSLLLIKNSDGFGEVLPTYIDPSYRTGVVYVAVLCAFSFFALIGLYYFIQFVANIIGTWFAVFSSTKGSSYRFVDVFIEDMASMQRLPRIKITANCTPVRHSETKTHDAE